MRYVFIKKNRSSFPVVKMCQTLNCSQSGYYRWLKQPESKRHQANQQLKQRIKELFQEHNSMAGSPMITADLRAEHKFSNIGKNRVARLMREEGLKCKTVKKFVVTTDSKHNEPVAENLLDRNFNVPAPNKVWVGDLTYLKVGRKWYYLSIFIDLYSRIIVGWDLSASLNRRSTIKALHKAILRRRPGRNLMIHSDRGIQYASGEFGQVLKKHNFIQSMSRKGNCWDNAVAESFFHTLKTQLIHHVTYQNLHEAEQSLFNYIEIYYNRRRRHSTNGYKSPADFENESVKYRKVA